MHRKLDSVVQVCTGFLRQILHRSCWDQFYLANFSFLRCETLLIITSCSVQVVNSLWCLTEMKAIANVPPPIRQSWLKTFQTGSRGVTPNRACQVYRDGNWRVFTVYRHCFKVFENPLLVFVSKTCAVLKLQMERPDIIVCTCSCRKVFPRKCMPQLHLIILIGHIHTPEECAPRKEHTPLKPNGRCWKSATYRRKNKRMISIAWSKIYTPTVLYYS